MNGMTDALLLLLVPAVPLLLALPALRRRLPWPVQLALLPAMVILFVPGSLCFDLNWVLLGGSGLAVDGLARWWLAMSIVAWGAASVILYSRASGEDGEGIQTTWFLLSMAAQLAAVVAADLVSFFAFSSLMGYAFFGLLVFRANAEAQRAGRIYLVFLVLADIILFEALLIVGVSSNDPGFTSLAAGTAMPPGASFALVLAFCGFALKVAIWPVHLWLAAAIASSRPAIVLCIWIAPVATGLLGMLRWMTLGDTASSPAAVFLQVLGGAAILYAAMYGLARARRQQVSAFIIIAVTGAVTLALGTGLADPGMWERHAGILPVFIVGVGLGLTILTVARAWLERTRTYPTPAAAPVIPASYWYERWGEAVVRWIREQALVNLPRLRASTLVYWHKRSQREKWMRRLDAGEQYFSVWAIAILLAVILSILFVIVGLFSGSGRVS